MEKKKVLFVASESVPFIKTGGLADVVGSLPKYFDKDKYDVRVMDEDVEAFASGAAFKVRVFRAGDIETTETSEYRITRKGKIHFEDLSKNALKKADHKLIEGVLPYDTRNMAYRSLSWATHFR